MKMEQTECSETSAYKIQTPGNYAEENIQQGQIFYVEVKVSHTAKYYYLIGNFRFLSYMICCCNRILKTCGDETVPFNGLRTSLAQLA